MADRPLILVTNDDGIDSPGLHAAAEAVADLGDLLIVAPSSQRTAAGRGHPPVFDKNIYTTEIPLNGSHYPAYKADFSPAQAVMMAVLELAEGRRIDLCVSGINFGENIGSGVTISGTVGAAIEAACFDIPALAVGLETLKDFHFNYSHEVVFSVAAHFARYFAQQVLSQGLPPGVDLLKIDVPATATPKTAWRITSISRQPYYRLITQRDKTGDQKMIDYEIRINPDTLEPDSDIYIFALEKKVSVAPMTIDLTAPVALENVTKFFNGNL
jgi:5'-nucleotidase